MPKISYAAGNFREDTINLIAICDNIAMEYANDGYSLTLRQLYYQLVARDYIPNTQKQYKRLVSTISKARLAGLIDWEHIVDRTRNLQRLPHWDDPGNVIASARASFRIDRWKNQPRRIEVYIEKDALIGVIENVCNDYDVPYFSCRGYTSLSEVWRAGNRMDLYKAEGKTPLIIHLGDHDPSGIDMTRDIGDRLETFMGGVEVKRIALNYSQVEEHNPPPNPTKLSDSRAAGYIEDYGYSSWELDALDPRTISGLISAEIDRHIDEEAWAEVEAEEREAMKILDLMSDRWGDVEDVVRREFDAF